MVVTAKEAAPNDSLMVDMICDHAPHKSFPGMICFKNESYGSSTIPAMKGNPTYI